MQVQKKITHDIILWLISTHKDVFSYEVRVFSKKPSYVSDQIYFYDIKNVSHVLWYMNKIQNYSTSQRLPTKRD